MDLSQHLQDLGVSEKEARVYISLLELSFDTVQNISKKSKVNRATTYVILKSLIEKGIVSTLEKDSKTYYVANEPKSIFGWLNHQNQEIIRRRNALESIIPQLQSIYNLNLDKPIVKFFEGEQGLIQGAREFYEEFSGKDDAVRLFYSTDLIEKNTRQEFRNEFGKARTDKKVKAIAIYNYAKGEKDPTSGSTRIRVDEKKFPISIDLEIYNDKVFISTIEENLSAVLIQNKQIADSLKTVFELAWLGAQEENKREK